MGKKREPLPLFPNLGRYAMYGGDRETGPME
jgi:hypothetical protein